MQQKTADELFRRDRHHFLPLRMTIVFPEKRNPTLFQRRQALVGNRDAMGVAAEILQHLLRPAERRLDVDYPIDPAQWRQPGAECFRIAEWLAIPEELEPAFRVGS